MSEYNFNDDPSPTLTTGFDATGSVVLKEGTTQGNLLSETFSASTISVSIKPPSQGWSISVDWGAGNTGVFPTPNPGDEQTYSFNYQADDPATGTSGTGTGSFKIRRAGSGGT